ncbi:hypothetical protein [Gemmiger formicilis]|uniref:hypothetical protein n=1 Tax=Gemmiger formicilis TaxID=745368 RepID=UPI00399141CD
MHVLKPCRNRVLTPGQTKNHFIRQRLDGIGSSDRTPKMMVLRGEMEHYLSLGCDHGRLED